MKADQKFLLGQCFLPCLSWYETLLARNYLLKFFFQGVLKTVSYRKQLRSFEGGQYQRADLGNGERIFSSAFLKLREVTLRVLDRFTCLWFLNEWGNNNLNWKEKGLTTHTKRQWPQKLVSTNRIIIGTFKTCGELKVLLNNITQFFVTLFLDFSNQN